MTHWLTSYLPRRSCGQKRPTFSAMYIMIAPDSNTEIGAPPPFGSWSTMTGIRWFGFIFRNSGVN